MTREESPDRRLLYRGKTPIEELDRETLIKCVYKLHRQLEIEQEMHEGTMSMFTALRSVTIGKTP